MSASTCPRRGCGELRPAGIVQAPEMWVDASTVFWGDGGSKSRSSLGRSSRLPRQGSRLAAARPGTHLLSQCLPNSGPWPLTRAVWSTAVVSAPRARVMRFSHGQSPLQLTLSVSPPRLLHGLCPAAAFTWVPCMSPTPGRRNHLACYGYHTSEGNAMLPTTSLTRALTASRAE